MINNMQGAGGLLMTEGHDADGNQIRSPAMKQPERVVLHTLGTFLGTLASAFVGRFVVDQVSLQLCE